MNHNLYKFSNFKNIEVIEIKGYIKKVPRQIKILVILLACLFLFGSLGYVLFKGVSFSKGLFLTLETLAFEYSKEVSFGERIFQLSIILFGTFFLWWTLWTIFDILLEGKFKEYFGEVKMIKGIDRLKNHYIVCGAGRVGIRVATELRKRGKAVVIAERDPVIAERLKENGFLVVVGTSADETTLLKAGIKKAGYLVAATGDDGKNILIILTAKELNPNIKIGARATDESIVPKLKHAGANYIVLPEVIGGIQLVEEMLD